MDDFKRGLEVAVKYRSTDFESKIGILSKEELEVKYKFIEGETDDIDVYKAYEYFEKRGASSANLEKLGLMVDETLEAKYEILKTYKDADVFDLFRSYEVYAAKNNIAPKNTIICFNLDGKILDIQIDNITTELQNTRPLVVLFLYSVPLTFVVIASIPVYAILSLMVTPLFKTRLMSFYKYTL